jgi:hypothetical protein
MIPLVCSVCLSELPQEYIMCDNDCGHVYCCHECSELDDDHDCGDSESVSVYESTTENES